MSRWLRLALVLVPCLILRFALGSHPANFLWFIALYLPTANWVVYWIFFSVRVGLNKLYGSDRITVARIRAIYVWYLHIPGSLVAAEIVYRGYLFNR